jgi:anaerobic magnesium-protoporphyrin IX monomethyl ester cyclase
MPKEQKNIILIAANKRAQGEPSLGIAYLASYIRKYHSSDSESIKISLLNYIPKSLDKIKNLKPAIIGISALTEQYSDAIKFAKSIKETCDVPLIIGGQHISMLPSSFDPIFAFGIIGEGEQTFLEVINLVLSESNYIKKLANINGVIFYKNHKLIKTPPRSLIKNLDEIPPPARDLFNMDFYLSEKKNVFGLTFGRGLHMFTSRGCPYNCTYCSSSAFWKHIRYHSAEYVINEIKTLINKYKVKYIHIFDDLFVFNKKRLSKIVELIVENKINKQVSFGVFARVDHIDTETCLLLKKMNVNFIEFGIESGTQQNIQYLKDGNITLEIVESAIALCKKHNFKKGGNFIIGNPLETEKDILQTLKFIKKLDLDKFAFYPCTLTPGSKLWNNFVEKKITQLKKNNKIISIEQEKIKIQKELLKKYGKTYLNKTVSKERFQAICKLFETERKKKHPFEWKKAFPEEE